MNPKDLKNNLATFLLSAAGLVLLLMLLARPEKGHTSHDTMPQLRDSQQSVHASPRARLAKTSARRLWYKAPLLQSSYTRLAPAGGFYKTFLEPHAYGVSLPVAMRWHPRCTAPDRAAVKSYLTQTGTSHILATVEAIDEVPGQHIAVKQLVPTADFLKGTALTLTLPQIETPRVLGLFLCAHRGAEKQCRKKPPLGSRSAGRRAPPAVLYFSPLIVSGTEVLTLVTPLSKDAAARVGAFAAAHVTGLKDPKALQRRIKSFQNQLASPAPDPGPALLTLRLPLNTPGCSGAVQSASRRSVR